MGVPLERLKKHYVRKFKMYLYQSEEVNIALSCCKCHLKYKKMGGGLAFQVLNRQFAIFLY